MQWAISGLLTFVQALFGTTVALATASVLSAVTPLSSQIPTVNQSGGPCQGALAAGAYGSGTANPSAAPENWLPRELLNLEVSILAQAAYQYRI